MKYYLGIDIGATNLKYVLVNSNCEILDKGSKKTKVKSYENFLEQISIVIKEFKEGKNRRPSAVGIVVPGFIDFKDKKVFYSPNLHILNDKHIWNDFEPILSPFDFVVDNDANAAAYGEYKRRREESKNLTDLVLLTLGSGVGGGVITKGCLLHGSRGFGAELGHIKIYNDGRTCGCKSTGCAEPYLSNYGIVDSFIEEIEKSGKPFRGNDNTLNAEKIAEMAFAGDSAATAAMRKTGERLGQLLSILINVFNPQIISIGGGIMEASELLLPPAIAMAKEKSIDPSFRMVKIEKAVLGSEAGAYGAAMLAKDLIDNK